MSKSDIIYGRSKTDKELHQILELQHKNLFENISDVQRRDEGFLTVEHTFGLLKKMNGTCPHVIAKVSDKVVGYALCMHHMFSQELELLKPMFKELQAILPENEKFIVMGQICVDYDFRKKGVFRNLYKTMKEELKPAFDSIITEVDTNNTRSLKAHFAVGFVHLKTHMSKGRSWELIVLK